LNDAAGIKPGGIFHARCTTQIFGRFLPAAIAVLHGQVPALTLLLTAPPGSLLVGRPIEHWKPNEQEA